MLTGLSKISLFISSFYPLCWVYFLMIYSQNMLLAWLIVIIPTLFVVIVGVLLTFLNKIGAEKMSVISVDTKTEATTSYLISYVLPFVSLPTVSDINQILAFGIFFVVLGYLYLQSNMIFINPLLTIIGFKILHVTNDQDDRFLLLTRSNVKRNESINVIVIGEGLLYGKNK